MPLLLDKAMPQLRRSLSLAQLTFYGVAPWSAAALCYLAPRFMRRIIGRGLGIARV